MSKVYIDKLGITWYKTTKGLNTGQVHTLGERINDRTGAETKADLKQNRHVA